MVTGVNATVNGGGGSGSTMTSSPAPPSGLGPAANGTSNSDQQMNGISIIEPAKRNGDNRRVSSGINSSVTSQLFFIKMVNDRYSTWKLVCHCKQGLYSVDIECDWYDPAG